MQHTEFKIEHIELSHSSYVFGPFIGELGWELFRWCGFVRWFKETYPDKEIIVCTRSGRQDLYANVADRFYAFQIDGDYLTLRPNMYRLDGDNAQMKIDKIKSDCEQSYPNRYFVTPPYHTINRFYYQSTQSFKFDTTNKCKLIINSLLSKFKNKIPIVICPRHRKDMIGLKLTRNWSEESWCQLFNLIKHDGRFIVFVAGDKDSICIPCFDPKKSIVLTLHTGSDASLIGLTIEAIKASKCTIGQQSALPILSNFLGTPTIMWGHEKYRHQTVENPLRTKCSFHESKDFQVPPVVIYNSLKGMVS